MTVSSCVAAVRNGIKSQQQGVVVRMSISVYFLRTLQPSVGLQCALGVESRALVRATTSGSKPLLPKFCRSLGLAGLRWLSAWGQQEREHEDRGSCGRLRGQAWGHLPQHSGQNSASWLHTI